MKKKFYILLFFLANSPLIWACPACEKQQPKITQGFTHGGGPASDWDWIIVGVIAAITILSFIFSLKYLLKPGEKNSNHIKYKILN